MTDIEKKALELVNEVLAKRGLPLYDEEYVAASLYTIEAICRAIEQHEAFRQEVSDALKGQFIGGIPDKVARFIITKPDPLVEALTEISVEGGFDNYDHYAHRIRSALEARGLEIREVE